MPTDPPKPILKSKCSVPFVTPSGSTTNLPVCCASSDENSWPFLNFQVTTVGTDNPITESIISRGSSFQAQSMYIGQTVIRAMFAYVATQSIIFNIQTKIIGYIGGGFTSKISGPYKMFARLYELSGAEVAEYISVEDNKESTSTIEEEEIRTIQLPATVCPKVLWIFASYQPDKISGRWPTTFSRVSGYPAGDTPA